MRAEAIIRFVGPVVICASIFFSCIYVFFAWDEREIRVYGEIHSERIVWKRQTIMRKTIFILALTLNYLISIKCYLGNQQIKVPTTITVSYPLNIYIYMTEKKEIVFILSIKYYFIILFIFLTSWLIANYKVR